MEAGQTAIADPKPPRAQAESGLEDRHDLVQVVEALRGVLAPDACGFPGEKGNRERSLLAPHDGQDQHGFFQPSARKVLPPGTV